MKEISSIIKAYDLAVLQGRQTALLTVVHVDGSSYRRPGARMLVTDEGQLTGAISGGCLEGDALRKALQVMQQQQSKLVTYDTTDEDDAVMGVGLGCNGIIQVLIEPINAAHQYNPIELLKQVIKKRAPSLLVTVFSLKNKNDEQAGTCLLYRKNEQFTTPNFPDSLNASLLADVEEAWGKQLSLFRNYFSDTADFTVFIEYLVPTVSLVVFGAGNDVVPLVEMAEILGWKTMVVDGRPQYANKERFQPSCTVLLARPEKILEKIEIDQQTVFLLMTHNYLYDMQVLEQLIQQPVSYIGSLGPRSKLERMITELKSKGARISGETEMHIFGPAGLDIGAETPEEIALSILSEIKAVLSARSGQFLRDNKDSIHSRSATRIEKVKLAKS